MKLDSYALQPDTILQGKYHILLPIGKGGFSITYLAEQTSDGVMVALKELFNREYMVRVAPENTVHIDRDPSLTRMERDRNQFMNEWTILKRFASYPGIVKPIELFEENNTVYIAMEHLSGGSLKDNVRLRGRYDADSVLEKTSKVLCLLAEMHKLGFVHGDISPDNLVLGEDGTFNLIDFGAVREIGTTRMTGEVLWKEGYTPAETMGDLTKSDKRSDIYSICATLYYALTGLAPMDSTERMYDDRLQPLSELRPEVDPIIDRLVMKGLSMDPEERWENIEEMQDVIRQYVKTEDERKREKEIIARRKRRKKICIASGIAAVLLLALVIFAVTHQELLKFKGADTRTIALYYDDSMGKEKTDILQKNIRQKLDHIAGDEYILKKKSGYFEISTKSEVFDNVDLPSFINKFFNFDYCTIGVDSEGSPFYPCEINMEKIDYMEEQEAGLLLLLSEETASKLQDDIEEGCGFLLEINTKGEGISMWDCENSPNKGNSYTMDVEYDPENRHLYISDDSFGGTMSRKLFVDCLSQDAIPISAYNYSRQIEWEQRTDPTWGEYQVEATELYGNTVLLDYTINYSSIYDPADITQVKQRLDSLKIQYACGFDMSNENELYVKVKEDAIWEIEAAMLCNNLYSSISSDSDNFGIKTASGIVPSKIEEFGHLVAENKKVGVKVEDIEAFLNGLERSEDKRIQLCLDYRPVFEAEPSDISNDGWVYFDTLILDNCNEYKEDEIEAFVEFVNRILDNNINIERYLTGALFQDQQGNINWAKTVWDLPCCEKTELRLGIMREFEEKGISAHWSLYSPDTLSVKAYYDKSLRERYTHPYSIIEEFLRTTKLTNEVNKVDIQIIVPEDEEDRYTWYTLYNMIVERNRLLGTPELEWFVQLFNRGMEFEDSFNVHDHASFKRNAAKEYLASQEAFASYILNPPLEYKYEQIVLDDDDACVKVSIPDTIPGQNYQLCFTVDNKTSQDLKLTLERLSFNNISTYISTSDCSFSANQTGSISLDFEEKDLHFSTFEPFQNASIYLTIEHGKEKKNALASFPDLDSCVRGFSNHLIPNEALLLDDTEEYSIYSLGYGQYDFTGFNRSIRFLLVNKTENLLRFQYEKQGFNNMWNEYFEQVSESVLPYSISYFDLTYSDYDPLVYGISDAEDLTSVSVLMSVLDSSHSQLLLDEKEFTITHQ